MQLVGIQGLLIEGLDNDGKWNQRKKGKRIIIQKITSLSSICQLLADRCACPLVLVGRLGARTLGLALHQTPREASSPWLYETTPPSQTAESWARLCASTGYWRGKGRLNGARPWFLTWTEMGGLEIHVSSPRVSAISPHPPSRVTDPGVFTGACGSFLFHPVALNLSYHWAGSDTNYSFNNHRSLVCPSSRSPRLPRDFKANLSLAYPSFSHYIW